MQKKWFTMIEILIIVAVISVGIMTLLTALRSSNTYVQKTRQKIIAINLAREGMEQVYNIRDTNWQRREGKKEWCWLKTNPMVDQSTTWCENDEWFQSWSYIIIQTWNEQKYFSAISWTTTLNIDDNIQTWDLQYSLCESNGIWSACIGQQPQSKEWRYFREIQGLGLFQKDVTQSGGSVISCPNWLSSNCGANTAKEYRFCSKVSYIGEWKWEVKLCWLITNFRQ